MTDRVTIDKAGRVVIPKTVRDALRIEPGDLLALEPQTDGVLLRPVRAASPLRKEQGVWVFHGERTVAADETDRVMEAQRQARGERCDETR